MVNRKFWLRKSISENTQRSNDRLTVVIVIGLLVLSVASIVFNLLRANGKVPGSGLTLGFVEVIGVVGVCALWWKDKNPGFVLFLVLGATLLEHRLHPYGTRSIYPIPFLVALLSYSVLTNWRKVVRVAIACIAVFTTVSLIFQDNVGPYGLYSFLGAVTFVVPVSSFGLWIGTRRALVVELRERSRRLERERELVAERAVADERVRIARDLHDVVAHHVSLMVIQAGAVRELLPVDSPLRSQLDALGSTGREAMAEMRRMLGLLRGSDLEQVPLAPSFRLLDIASLVERAVDAGFDLSFRLVGAVSPLGDARELCLYRVAQEAVTNILKHTKSSSGYVELKFAGSTVTLTVENYGEIAQTYKPGGHGIAGMNERVSLFGGTLSAQPIFPNGFRVHAKLPIQSAAVA